MDQERTCFNCQHRSVCFVFRDITETTKHFPVNIDGDSAPGKWTEVFAAMGKCCLKFKLIENEAN